MARGETYRAGRRPAFLIPDVSKMLCLVVTTRLAGTDGKRLNSFNQELQIFGYSFRGVVLTAVASVIRQLFPSDQRKEPEKR